MFQQVLICIIVFLALAFGCWLAQAIPEEMKPGKKYFKIMEIMLGILVILALFYETMIREKFQIVGVFALAVTYAVLKFPQKSIPIYAAVLFGILFQNSMLIASLGLLYGLPVGTLLGSNRRK